MSQHDLEITNGDANTGLSVRAAINAALQALGSLQAGATAPGTTYAYMLWADTTTGLLKIRNAANDAWIIIGPLATPTTLAQLFTAQGDIAYASAANTPTALPKAGANLKLFMNAANTVPEWAAGIKILSFSHLLDAASGDVAYTTIGFKPSHAIFVASMNETERMSIGFDSGTAKFVMTSNHVGVAGDFGYTNIASIYITEDNGKTQRGYVSAWGADGFTITWTRTGATAAGTINIYAMFFR